MPSPFRGLLINPPRQPNIKRRYSVTGDVVAFRRCARQYGAFHIHKYAPAYQTQIYFGTILHQVLDRCHSHFHGVIDPTTQGRLPDNGQILSDEEIINYFYEDRDAERARITRPAPPSDIVRYFVEVENGLKSQGIRSITPDLRVKAVRILQYFNALEGSTLYSRVRDTEHRLQADRTDHILNGVVDLLLNTEDGSDSPADCEMWDYKGSSRVNLNSEDLRTYEFQMRVYARLYELKHGVLPRRAVLYFMNELDGPTCPTQRPVNALVDVSLEADEIELAITEFTATVHQIEQSRRTDQWQPAGQGTISEQDCAICDLRWDCPTPNINLRYP